MARRSKQLQDEITAALAQGTPHPEAAVSDWKKRIAAIQRQSRTTGDPSQRAALQRQLDAASDGLRAAQRVVAHKPTYVTDINLFALKEMVLEHDGPEFPSRVPAVHAPHLKRTVEAGLVEVNGSRAHLTAAGREIVADALIKDIDREGNWRPRENTFVTSPEKRAEILARDRAEHAAKIAKLEATLAKIGR
jgi:hypothetical protein